MDLRKIDIEIHSFCNRCCKWCSNSVYKRDFYIEMKDSVFSKIIDELKQINYKGPVFFTRYNEPFYNRDYLKRRIKEVREKLPNNKIGCNTNGDYNYDDYDLDYITVTDYDNKLEEMCDEEKGIRIFRLQNICDRGGILKNLSKKRTNPCFEPHYVVAIDYLGNITFCCNMRIECPTHTPYIFGNIENISILEAFNSKEAKRFREDVKIMDFPEPCKYCDMKPGRFSRKTPSLCRDMDSYEDS